MAKHSESSKRNQSNSGHEPPAKSASRMAPGTFYVSGNAFWTSGIARRVGASAAFVYDYLRYRRRSDLGTAWPGVEEIAGATGFNKSTVSRLLKKLEAAGLIFQEKEGWKRGENVRWRVDLSCTSATGRVAPTQLEKPNRVAPESKSSCTRETASCTSVVLLNKEEQNKKQNKKQNAHGGDDAAERVRLLVEFGFKGGELAKVTKLAKSETPEHLEAIFENIHDRRENGERISNKFGLAKSMIANGADLGDSGSDSWAKRRAVKVARNRAAIAAIEAAKPAAAPAPPIGATSTPYTPEQLAEIHRQRDEARQRVADRRKAEQDARDQAEEAERQRKAREVADRAAEQQRFIDSLAPGEFDALKAQFAAKWPTHFKIIQHVPTELHAEIQAAVKAGKLARLAHQEVA